MSPSRWCSTVKNYLADKMMPANEYPLLCEQMYSATSFCSISHISIMHSLIILIIWYCLLYCFFVHHPLYIFAVNSAQSAVLLLLAQNNETATILYAETTLKYNLLVDIAQYHEHHFVILANDRIRMIRTSTQIVNWRNGREANKNMENIWNEHLIRFVFGSCEHCSLGNNRGILYYFQHFCLILNQYWIGNK